MKVVDLINKIAKYEKVPQRIRYGFDDYIYRADINDYESKIKTTDKRYIYEDYIYLFDNYFGKPMQEFLNDDIIILDD